MGDTDPVGEREEVGETVIEEEGVLLEEIDRLDVGEGEGEVVRVLETDTDRVSEGDFVPVLVWVPVWLDDLEALMVLEGVLDGVVDGEEDLEGVGEIEPEAEGDNEGETEGETEGGEVNEGEGEIVDTTAITVVVQVAVFFEESETVMVTG